LLELRRLYLELGPAARQCIATMMLAAANDPEGSVFELLRRHERGERVAVLYLDAETDEHVTIPEGKPIPRRQLPILETLALAPLW